MKKFILVLLSILMMPFIVHAEYQIGDYFQIGSYRGELIIWRYVSEDDNGKLLLSDKVLLYSDFSTAELDSGGYTDFSYFRLWKTSQIRAWLNATAASSENIELFPEPLQTDRVYIGRDIGTEESGFLNDSNFTPSQKSLMKNVRQWTMLPYYIEDLVENDTDIIYSYEKSRRGNPMWGEDVEYYDISELPGVYAGAAYRTYDRMFLIDEMQLYNIWQNFGNVVAEATDMAQNNKPERANENGYYLRTGSTVVDGKYRGYVGDGIRPAFYLNESAIDYSSGSGTLDDPYILDGTLPITVYYGENEMLFDQEPIIENDRVLVPMRTIFEKLGAEVEWDEESETITAMQEENSVTMQIGSSTLIKNGEEITLDTAPQIVNGRTLVPVRAVSESLDAEVDWNSYITRVIITK